MTPVVKFDWDHKYYFGNLVAVHASLDFVAYALKGCWCSAFCLYTISSKTGSCNGICSNSSSICNILHLLRFGDI